MNRRHRPEHFCWTEIALAFFAMLMFAGNVSAGGELFDGCVDVRGRLVTTTVDYGLPRLALAAMENGKAVMRYNPAQLPGLSPRARLFYFAHECARLALGQAPGVERSIEQARQADCWALATLRRSGELAPDEAVRTLEVELTVDEADWAALPGPVRTIDLAACGRPPGALQLPDSAPPSEAQSRLNRCVQGCGDRLWQCQNRCRDESCRGQCLGGYRSCESACGSR